MIGLAIVPLPGANYVSHLRWVLQAHGTDWKEVPADITLNIALDQTGFIKRSISEVEETLLISFLLVVLIIYLFFRDPIIALRPLIDIPVSIDFNILHHVPVRVFGECADDAGDCTFATGLVVDDGIVVTENIYKTLSRVRINTIATARKVPWNFLCPLFRHPLRWRLYSCRYSCKGLPDGCSGVWRGCRWRGIDFMFCIVLQHLYWVLSFPGSSGGTPGLQSNRAGLVYRNGNRIPQHAPRLYEGSLGLRLCWSLYVLWCMLHR